jgi:hypothetical protein
MNDLPLLIMIASIIGLSVLTTNWYFNTVMAVTIGNGGGGAAVIQEQVSTDQKRICYTQITNNEAYTSYSDSR